MECLFLFCILALQLLTLFLILVRREAETDSRQPGDGEEGGPEATGAEDNWQALRERGFEKMDEGFENIMTYSVKDRRSGMDEE